ncbi:MAG: FixH family protein [Silicimonas sp.]
MIEREITGKHVLIGTIAAFGVIIAVNFTMAYQAIGTFPGLEVKNSYVASQSFDARREAQQALGWEASATIEGGLLKIALSDAAGRPAQPSGITAVLGRPTIARDDRVLDLVRQDGVFTTPVDLDRGAWIVKLTATSDAGVEFAKRMDIWVR